VNATGSGTGSVSAHAVARRAPDGSCDVNQAPIVELDVVSSTGTLSF
jgi:hypothetical protein